MRCQVFQDIFLKKIILERGFMKHKGCCVNLRKAYHFLEDYEFVTLAYGNISNGEYGDNRTKSMFFYEIWYDYPYVFRRISYFNDTTSEMRCQVFRDIFSRKIILEGGFMKHKGCCVNSRRRTEMRAWDSHSHPFSLSSFHPFSSLNNG